jgi:5-methylcytosine-specific restriction enzyme B
MKLGSVGTNYETYMTMCEVALSYIKPSYNDLTMLDVQDFFLYSTQYYQIIVESAVEYLQAYPRNN